jgi:hypothetical protein
LKFISSSEKKKPEITLPSALAIINKPPPHVLLALAITLIEREREREREQRRADAARQGGGRAGGQRIVS